jgi:hypothetical protein
MYRQKLDETCLLDSIKGLNSKYSDPYTEIINEYRDLAKLFAKKPDDSQQRHTVSRTQSQQHMLDLDYSPKASKREGISTGQTLLDTVWDLRTKLENEQKSNKKNIEDIQELRQTIRDRDEQIARLKKENAGLAKSYCDLNDEKEKIDGDYIKQKNENEMLFNRFLAEKENMATQWNKIMQDQELTERKQEQLREKEAKLNQWAMNLRNANAQKNMGGVGTNEKGRATQVIAPNTFNFGHDMFMQGTEGDLKHCEERPKATYTKTWEHPLHTKKISTIITDNRSELIGSCSDDGLCKIFSVISCKELASLNCQGNMAISIDFHAHNPDAF